MTTNYILTWAWVGAFILMLVADILLIYWPSLPVWIGVGVAFAARNCAVYFTNWYSARRHAQFARQAP
jgi:alkanesulfonate monooxygenase SsuD/methylene tetrahydromethanopterin reductase-like flavin-dependent oxidoreductase (luciferase family)